MKTLLAGGLGHLNQLVKETPPTEKASPTYREALVYPLNRTIMSDTHIQFKALSSNDNKETLSEK